MNLGEFALKIFVCNVLALGSGPVMFPLIRRSFVREGGALSADQLLFALAIAQATPGQANLYVASLGYMMYGVHAALLAVFVINFPAYVMLLLVRWYERIHQLAAVRRFIRGMTSASVGLILAATFEMAHQVLTQPGCWFVFLLTLTLTQKLRWNSMASLLAASAAGMLIMIRMPGY